MTLLNAIKAFMPPVRLRPIRNLTTDLRGPVAGRARRSQAAAGPGVPEGLYHLHAATGRHAQTAG
jgi:hypothetical protein